MGKLVYGSGGPEFEFEDRLLAHLQTVITAKLRRNERFIFSWTLPTDSGGGRCSVWVDPSIPLSFRFPHTAVGPVNRSWLEDLMASANSVGGLNALPEPQPAPVENPASGQAPRPAEEPQPSLR